MKDSLKDYIAILRNSNLAIHGIILMVKKKEINETQALIRIAQEQRRASGTLKLLEKEHGL